MVHTIAWYRMLRLAPVALVLAAACHDAGPTRSLTLSITAKSVTTASLPVAAGLDADIVVGSGSSAITITKVQLFLSEIELSPGSTCSTTDEHDGCDELEVGPVPVDLPVDGTTKVFLDKLVPPGTYAALDAKVDSVIVTFTEGTTSGQTFKLAMGEDAQIEAAFQPPVTVDATTSNLTIDVDVASWFKDSSGAVLDPNDQANAMVIRDNVLRSFNAFEDDNHDGEDDAMESGGGDH